MLLGLPMERVLPAARAMFPQFQPRWIVPTILLGGVVLFLTLGTCQSDDHADRFRLFGHSQLTSLRIAPQGKGTALPL